MKMRFGNFSGTLNAGLLLLAGLACAPMSNAQQFSDWSAAVNLGPVVNSGFTDQHPAISKDGLRLYISSDRPGGFGGQDIWVSRRASLEDPWEVPINLGPNINSSGDDYAPSFSTDGHVLFFHSNHPGGCGGFDLYFSRRHDQFDDFGWEPALNLDFFGRDPQGPLLCTVNTTFDDAGPTYFQDETGKTVLYLNSNRPGGLGDFDFYITTLQADGTWGFAAPVSELNSPYRDTRTAIRRRDGLEIFFGTNRPGGLGRDIWVSTRSTTQDLWSTPVPLGPTVNSTAVDGGPALSWDGTTLFFYSNRPGGFGGNDLYMSTRTKLTGPQP
jgi:hypothetical protein